MKQASLKAIGSDFRAGIAFSGVVLQRAAGTALNIRLSGGVAIAAAVFGVTDWKLRINCALGIALAGVLHRRPNLNGLAPQLRTDPGSEYYVHLDRQRSGRHGRRTPRAKRRTPA